MFLETDNTVLVLVDVQEKLTAVMHERDALVAKLETLVRTMQVLDIPIIPLQQNPDKMGPTIEPLRSLLGDRAFVNKMCFSCYGADDFRTRLEATGRRQVLIAGIEAHVCIYQSAVDLIRESYAVEVVVDAVSSRRASDKTVAIEKIQASGRHSVGSGQGHITTVETAIFELMRSAKHVAFRDILKIVK